MRMQQKGHIRTSLIIISLFISSAIYANSTFKVEQEIQGLAGSTISVDILLTNTEALQTGTVEVDFTDNGILSLPNGTDDITIKNNVAGDPMKFTTGASKYVAGAGTFNFGTTVFNIGTDVVIATFDFKVDDAAIVGQTANVVVSVSEGAGYGAYKVSNGAFDSHTLISSTFTVVNEANLTFQTDGTTGATLSLTNQSVIIGENASPVTTYSPVGYHFDNWTWPGDYSSDNPFSFSNVTTDTTITANFSINTYNVAFQTDGTAGTSLSGIINQVIAYGNSSNLVTANIPVNCIFNGWTWSNGSSNNNPISIPNIVDNMIITANYTFVTYNISFQTDGTTGASLSGNPDQLIVQGESSVPVTAVAPAGWRFSHWTYNDTKFYDNPLQIFYVSSDLDFTAHFVEEYTITFDLGSNAVLSSGQLIQTIAEGSNAVAPSVLCNIGYKLISWDKSLSNITQNVTITAEYTSAPAVDGYIAHAKEDLRNENFQDAKTKFTNAVNADNASPEANILKGIAEFADLFENPGTSLQNNLTSFNINYTKNLFGDENGEYNQTFLESEPFTDENSNGERDEGESFYDYGSDQNWNYNPDWADNDIWDTESFTDTNNNGWRDDGEYYTDENGNQQWDYERYWDQNNNNVRDPGESYTDTNSNGKYDEHLIPANADSANSVMDTFNTEIKTKINGLLNNLSVAKENADENWSYNISTDELSNDNTSDDINETYTIDKLDILAAESLLNLANMAISFAGGYDLSVDYEDMSANDWDATKAKWDNEEDLMTNRSQTRFNSAKQSFTTAVNTAKTIIGLLKDGDGWQGQGILATEYNEEYNSSDLDEISGYIDDALSSLTNNTTLEIDRYDSLTLKLGSLFDSPITRGNIPDIETVNEKDEVDWETLPSSSFNNLFPTFTKRSDFYAAYTHYIEQPTVISGFSENDWYYYNYYPRTLLHTEEKPKIFWSTQMIYGYDTEKGAYGMVGDKKDLRFEEFIDSFDIYRFSVNPDSAKTKLGSVTPASFGEWQAWNWEDNNPPNADSNTYYVDINFTSTDGGETVTSLKEHPTFSLDNDQNNLPDWWEAKYNISNAWEDDDNDGLSNYDEYRYGTNPNDSDTDDDGLLDDEIIWKFDPLVPNDLEADDDGDGIPNQWEYEHQLYENDNSDTHYDFDGDGLTNFQEFQNNTDPYQQDTDQDGISDGDEVAFGTDPNKADTDDDGLTDSQELELVVGWIQNPENQRYYKLSNNYTNWTSADSAAKNAQANLVTIRSEQENLWVKENVCKRNECDYQSCWIGFTDQQTEGIWKWSSDEPVVYSNWAYTPSENYDYAYIHGYSAEWYGYSYSRNAIFETQNIPESTDPNDADTDDDGMTDGWEVTHNLNPLVDDASDDPDDDGIKNLFEFLADIDPNTPNDNLKLLVLTPGWNLISIPDGLENPTVNSVFGDVLGIIWKWNSLHRLYIDASKNNLDNLEGYWIYVDELKIIPFQTPDR